MPDWFRVTEWTPAAAEEFDSRLARSRSQKAQYLRIQGSTLKDSNPAAAASLLRRCIEIGDDSQTAGAWLDLGYALYRSGHIDNALQALESAIEQETRQPLFRTSAPFDYAMLVVLHDRAERFDRALEVLDTAAALYPLMEFQRESARAIILHSKGRREEAQLGAQQALAAGDVREGWIPAHPQVGVVPDADNQL